MSLLEKVGKQQMVDVPIPTSDGRELILSRSTQPEAEQTLPLEKRRLKLPEQLPPRIRAATVAGAVAV